MAGPEDRPLGASSSTEMAELAGEVMHRAATRAEQKSLAGCVLALHDMRVNPNQLRRVFRALRKTDLSISQEVEVSKLEALLFPPKPPKVKRPEKLFGGPPPKRKAAGSPDVWQPTNVAVNTVLPYEPGRWPAAVLLAVEDKIAKRQAFDAAAKKRKAS
jgi:hypothetical protein